MDEKPKDSETKSDDFKELKDRFAAVSQLWDDDMQRYRDDMHFLHVDHWPEGVRRQRTSDITNPRLCLEIDQLSQFQRQVINDSRQNRPQIKVRPVDNKADVETATMLDGLCRHWQEAGNADTAYDVSLDCATGGGFGYFRILHDYLHDGTFDQDFYFGQVQNPLTIFFGEHKELDGSDAKECWIIEDIKKKDFEKMYPGKNPVSFATDVVMDTDTECEFVRVAGLYEIREEPRTMHLLMDGTVCTDEEYQKSVAEGAVTSEIKMSREIPKKCLYWSKFSAENYLEDPRKEPGDRIPVFPVWGNIHNIDGKTIRTSMIHKSKDAQLLYDYAQTAFAERVGQSPEAPWVAAAGQVSNYEHEWDGTTSVRVQHYDPVSLEGTVLPAPQRQNPSDVPAGFAQVMQMAEHGIQTSLGMYSASIGKKGNATSGVQEQEQARKGDVSSFHYHDNLARAIRSAGRYLISAAPEILDTKRVVRILGLDGKAQQAKIDPSLQVAVLKAGANSIFNIGVGKYDVAVDVGPSYQTSRQAASAGMLALAQADPTMWQTHGDLIAEAQDWPDAQRFAERSKMLLPPPVLAAEQAQQEDSPEVAQVRVQAEQAIAQKDEAINAAADEIERLRQENQKLQFAAQQAALKAQQTQVKCDSDILQMNYKLAEANIKIDEQDAVERVQQLAQQHQQSMGEMQQEQQPQEPQEPQMDVAQILQAVASMQQPITITVPVQIDGKGATVKQGRAVKQADGSFMMESVETPVATEQQAM